MHGNRSTGLGPRLDITNRIGLDLRDIVQMQSPSSLEIGPIRFKFAA